MAVKALIGLQWGDEGNGKVVDGLSAQVDVVVRAQGGANAGHTVKVGDKTRVLHLVPSGMLYPHVLGIVGNGVVLDPVQLLKEIDDLDASGVAIADRLLISERAHLVLPYHKAMDAALEELRGGSAIGTTRRGIGPAYMDKAARTGITAAFLRDPDELAKRVTAELEVKRRLFAAVGVVEPGLSADSVLDELLPVAKRLAPLVTDTVARVHDEIAADKEVLIEGAQGSLLDLDLGTYPYVTSSSCHLGGLLAGSGIPPRALDRVIGIAKAYCTRVGGGPFPSEDLGDDGQKLRDLGHEYGSTTGRPRRCGWLDLVALAFACRTNGVDEIVLTKTDVLTAVDHVRVATHYELDGERTTRWPSGQALERVQPVYENLPGFDEDLSRLAAGDALPAALERLIAMTEQATGAVVSAVSVGPERAQMLPLGASKR